MSRLVKRSDREAVHYLPPAPGGGRPASISCGKATNRYTREPADVTCADCYAHPTFPKDKAPPVEPSNVVPLRGRS